MQDLGRAVHPIRGRRHDRRLPHARPAPRTLLVPATTGLSITELTVHGTDGRIVRKIESLAGEAPDAYLAREILNTPIAVLLPDDTTTSLRTLVDAAGLDTQIPPHLAHNLNEALDQASTVLADSLARPANA